MARKSANTWTKRVSGRMGSPQIDVTLPGFGAAVGRGSDRVRIASRTTDAAVYARRVVLLRTLAHGHEALIDALIRRTLTWRTLERAYEAGPLALRDLLRTASTPAWSVAVTEFVRSYRRRGVAKVERQLRTFGDALSDRLDRPATVADCTTANVTWFLTHAERQDGRGGTLSGSTLNRYRAALSSFCRWAVQREYLTVHPIAFGKLPAQPEGKPRMPAPQPATVLRYLDAIWRHDPDPLQRRALVLALCTLTGGDLESEVMRIRPDDFVGSTSAQGVASVLYRREKTRTRERLVPLVDERTVAALQALLAATRRGEVRMFRDLTPAKVWTVHRKARAAADMPDVNIKDLRHVAAQLWRRAGADLQQVRDWLGHASLLQTQIYAAFGPDEAMDTPIARRLQALLRPGGAP